MARSIHDDLTHDEEQELLEGMSRRTLAVIIAVLLVISTVGALIILYSVDEGRVLSVSLVGPSRDEDRLTIIYTIETERALASGPGTFAVAFNGSAVLSMPVNVRDGGGKVDLRLGQFVMGNGDYTFSLAYKGVEGVLPYTIGTQDRTDFIVTGIHVNTMNETWVGTDLRTGAIDFSVEFLSDPARGLFTRAPPNASIAIQVRKNTVADGPAITRRVDGTSFYHTTLNVSLGPGNYTVDVTLTNQWVRDDAPVKVLTGDNGTFVHNKPTACVVGAPYHGNNANGFNITADGSCSADDLQIVQYSWSFGDQTPVVTSGSSPYEAHQYPSSTLLRSYTATLTVFDNLGQWDTVTFEVTTGAN